MKLLQKVLNKFNGLHYPQEYLCLAKESFQQPLHVYLISGNEIIKKITSEHLFTGYSPLIMTLYFSAVNKQDLPATIDIAFSNHSLQPNELLGKKDAIARLSLKKIRKQSAGSIDIFYYEGVHGEHRFLSSFHQCITGLYNMLYNKKTGNVFLHSNLYKQVQIAYAVPRIISLITVSDGQSYNLFPTDLHGPVNDQYYVGSLRHEGKACEQVEKARRIVISHVHYEAYKTVYSLGKNHMQELKPKDSFPFGGLLSNLFQLPLPKPVLYYRELELVESFNHGIHKLLLFKVLFRQAISEHPATLAHIHNAYATWRHNKGLSGNYLLR
jgi:flavin reductase (DIM6/NTAB) family NADH-FMN oxidoreductase RutF